MRAVEVVVAEVLLQIACERGQLGHERAGKGRSPALLEDRLLQALDVAVRLRPSSPDAAVFDVELAERAAEVARAKLGAVVRDHRLETPTGTSELGGDPLDECRAVPHRRVARRGIQRRPGEARGDVDRRVLPDGPFRSGEAAHGEAVEPDQLTGTLGLDVALGLGPWRHALVAGAIAGDPAQAPGGGGE